MGVGITDERHVGLFDPISSTAFGPIFSSAVAAWKFLDWLPPSEGDPVDMNESRLMHMFDMWKESQR